MAGELTQKSASSICRRQNFVQAVERDSCEVSGQCEPIVASVEVPERDFPCTW